MDSMAAYTSQTLERKIGSRIISVTNLTPEFSADGKRKVKLQTEAKLYDVFCKYVSCKF